jgi:hypothetical protein
MGDIESFTELLADGINNEQFLSSVGHLKCVRKLSLRGHWKWDWNLPYRPSPNSSWILAFRITPTSTIWRVLGKLKLVGYSLSGRVTNCVDFRGLSSLEELDLSRNNFFHYQKTSKNQRNYRRKYYVGNYYQRNKFRLKICWYIPTVSPTDYTFCLERCNGVVTWSFFRRFYRRNDRGIQIDIVVQ